MTDAIEHRGPDEDGHHIGPGVALGMRRLSIIDLPGSSQPISNEDGAVTTVFNGEIYNYPALRKSLQARGHQLRTSGDTETIVHLYEDRGERFVDDLRGMFGIALWDSDQRRLLLARDRMGVKPLYVAENDQGLAFASEVKALIAGGLVVPRLDPIAAELFLAFGYVPGPRTLFAGVRKVEPASVLVWEDGRVVSERRFWEPSTERAAPTRAPTWDEDIEALREVLRASVRDRMISDVPLGVMLSGGLDSSLLTALMSEVSPGSVKTFSIGFAEDEGANELDDAQLVANRLGTDHYPMTTRATEHPDLLDKALWSLEEPIADLSHLGFLMLSQLTREHVTVALSGQGADEILGGYRKHQIAALADIAQQVPRPLRAALRKASRLSRAGSSLERGLVAVLTDDHAERLLAMSRVMLPSEREQTLTADFLQHDAEGAIRNAVVRNQSGHGLSALGETLYLDGRLALVDNMLLYFDKMSMAASLEVRVPFMDHDVVSFCLSLPDDRRVHRLRRKEILRRASQGLVPPEILTKPKQAFFRSALGTWLEAHRDTFVRETLLDTRTRERGLYRQDTLQSLVGTAGSLGARGDRRLYSLLLLERWHRIFIDKDGEARRWQPSSDELVA